MVNPHSTGLKEGCLEEIVKVSLPHHVSRAFPSDFCLEKKDGNHPHPEMCTLFVQCVAHKYAYVQPCPNQPDGTPLWYVQNSGPDSRTSRCGYPAESGCNGDKDGRRIDSTSKMMDL
jgi:hypothetical protein